jgi:hypothetical protein
MALLAMGSVGTTIQKNPIRMNMNSLRIRYFHMPLLTAKETGKDSALTQIPCYIMRQPQKILDDLGNLADENTIIGNGLIDMQFTWIVQSLSHVLRSRHLPTPSSCNDSRAHMLLVTLPFVLGKPVIVCPSVVLASRSLHYHGLGSPFLPFWDVTT